MIKQRQYRGGYQLAGLLEFARELRKRQTSAEDFLWQLLRNRRLLGVKFRRQHQFGDFVIDFYCREASLAIECDGAVHKRNEQWHHDQNRDAYMIGQGLRVIRISNERILNDTENVLIDIALCLPYPSGRVAGGGGLATTSKPSPRPSPRGRGR
jgi:very-short-patch-repair endonuclease